MPSVPDPKVVKENACPDSWGKPLAVWLDDQGYPSAVPTIRSSDLKALQDPFKYYLTRRLNLRKPYSYVKALARGSWFHTVFKAWASYPDPKDLSIHVQADVLRSVIDELHADQAMYDWPLGLLPRMVDQNRVDCQSALAHFLMGIETPFGPGKSLTVQGILRHPDIVWLSMEDLFLTMGEPVRGKSFKQQWLVAQPDLLFYNKKKNELWIVDIKTTTLTTEMRLSACSWEFQTHHYFHVVKKCLEAGVLPASWGLPASAVMGGVAHIAFQMSPLTFGAFDRDYTIDTSPFLSGPRKGTSRNERIYAGEPKLENYVARVKDWLRGEGLYSHESDVRKKSPPVDVSWVPASVITQGTRVGRYTGNLEKLRWYSGCPAEPCNFPIPSEVPTWVDHDCPFSKMKRSHPSQWPQILREGKVIHGSRDDNLPVPTAKQPQRVIVDPF